MSLTAGSRVALASGPRGNVPQVMHVWPIFRLRGAAAWSERAAAPAATVLENSRRVILVFICPLLLLRITQPTRHFVWGNAIKGGGRTSSENANVSG